MILGETLTLSSVTDFTTHHFNTWEPPRGAFHLHVNLAHTLSEESITEPKDDVFRAANLRKKYTAKQRPQPPVSSAFVTDYLPKRTTTWTRSPSIFNAVRSINTRLDRLLHSPSIHTSVYPHLRLSGCLSVYLSIYLSDPSLVLVSNRS